MDHHRRAPRVGYECLQVWHYGNYCWHFSVYNGSSRHPVWDGQHHKTFEQVWSTVLAYAAVKQKEERTIPPMIIRPKGVSKYKAKKLREAEDV